MSSAEEDKGAFGYVRLASNYLDAGVSEAWFDRGDTLVSKAYAQLVAGESAQAYRCVVVQEYDIGAREERLMRSRIVLDSLGAVVAFDT